MDLNQPLKGDESAPQPKATRFVAPSFVSCQLELPTSPLNLAFSFLLVLHVRVHFRPVQTNRINTISTNPKRLPQYGRCLSSRNLLNTRVAVLPFTIPTNVNTDAFRGTITSRCTWSSCTFNSTTSTCWCSLNARLHQLTSSNTRPVNIRYRFFRTHTMWY